MNAREAEDEATAIEKAFDRLRALRHSSTDDAQNADGLRRMISDSGLPASTRARLYTWLADILESSK